MFNTKCKFNNKTGHIEFEELKWRVPIQAIKQIKMLEKKDNIELKITTDGKLQNELLFKYGFDKVKDTERSLNFNSNRKTTARDFVWHLIRIHHF